MSTATETATSTLPRLKQKYHDEVKGALKTELDLANVMQVPKLEKIVINMGVGRATQQPSLLEGAVKDLTRISGQKPIITKARNSIAGFKLREGQSIGCKVTLRGDRMWEFFDRLISVAIPRIRDFRGLPGDELGRAWQLHVRPHRAGRVPGDRLRQDRRPSRHGHHHRHDGGHQRAGQGPARRVRFPVQAGGRRVGSRKDQAPRTSVPRQGRSRQVLCEEEVTEGHRNGKEVIDQQSECQAEVQGAWLQPLPPVRPGAFGVPQVRAVPCLPPQMAHAGEIPGMTKASW